MCYGIEYFFDLLYKGFYKGYWYAVVSYGHHPCCYVALENNHPYYEVEYEDISIDCHGGCTYSNYGFGGHRSVPKVFDKSYWVIGWDYSHFGDYVGLPFDPIGKYKRWTTEEMIIDCKNVIEQLDFISKIKEKIYA